jgi:hypothetical protein
VLHGEAEGFAGLREDHPIGEFDFDFGQMRHGECSLVEG